MCLFSKEGELKVAAYDIQCFKAVNLDDGVVRPYFRTEYFIPDDVVNGDVPYVAEGIPEPDYDCYYHPFNYQWRRGLIHTYVNKLSAIYPNCDGNYTLVYACTIPKGTMYVDGEDCCDKQCYASEKIIFGKCVFDGRKDKIEIMHK